MNIGILESTFSSLSERSRRRKIRPEMKKDAFSTPHRTSTRGDTVGHGIATADLVSCSYPTTRKELSTAPTKSIPISHMKRTASELQLVEDEAMAEVRDYCMYTRIVNGMDPHQTDTVNSIMRTRHLPVRETSYSYQDDFDKYAMASLETASRISAEPDPYYGSNLPPTFTVGGPMMITEPDDEDFSPAEHEDGVFVLDL